ncbi:MAG: leucine-rich repeat protein, partial [Clostridia bacterium]|nr:leucine-rich repeat protein [Clostridia bacterium]
MKLSTRFISLLLSLLILVSTFGNTIPVFASTETNSNDLQNLLELPDSVPVNKDPILLQSVIDSGNCGEAVTWSLDSDGVLTFEGIGAIYNYSSDSQPWATLKKSIKEVVVKDGVTKIGDYAFYGCVNLESSELAESVKTIGAGAFYDCDALVDVVIPDTVTSIGEYSFAYCDNLESIVIGEGIKTITNYAFRDCVSLKTVTLPLFVRNVGYEAFRNCSKLKDVYCEFTNVMWNSLVVENSNEYNQYFLNATRHFETTTPAEVLYSGKCGEAVTWSLDSDGVLTVEGIGAIYNYSSDNQPWAMLKKSVKKVVVKDGVTKIGDYAFYGCVNLESSELAESVKTIGARAFYDCDSLVDVVVPDTVTSIGEYSFAYCDNLESIVIGEGIKTITNYAFRDCASLKTVNLPLSVKNVGYEAFRNCPKLKDVYCEFTEVMWNSLVVENSSEYNQYFLNATRHFETKTNAEILYSGKCGEAVTWSLDSNGVLTLEGIGAIYNYSNNDQPWASLKKSIKKVVVKDGVTKIGDYAFYGCVNLESFEFAESVKTIGSRTFYDCDSLVDVVVPDTVTSIGEYSFAYCDNLESVVIGEGVKTITSYAFRDCVSLKTITISLAVKNVGYESFRNCSKLKDVYCEFTEVMWNSLVVENSGEYNQYFLNATRHFETKTNAEILYSGKCGEAATWSLDSNGVLKLEGQGNLYNYSSNDYPWYRYRLSVTKIIIDQKLGTISDQYTKDCVNATSIEMTEGNPITGGCGDSVNWSISNGILIIDGYGAMYDYYSGNRPWEEYKLAITKVIIEEGVTRIGNYAFYNCSNLHTVEMADSVE